MFAASGLAWFKLFSLMEYFRKYCKCFYIFKYFYKVAELYGRWRQSEVCWSRYVQKIWFYTLLCRHFAWELRVFYVCSWILNKYISNYLVNIAAQPQTDCGREGKNYCQNVYLWRIFTLIKLISKVFQHVMFPVSPTAGLRWVGDRETTVVLKWPERRQT